MLTGFGRGLSLTTRIAGRLPKLPPIIELDGVRVLDVKDASPWIGGVATDVQSLES